MRLIGRMRRIAPLVPANQTLEIRFRTEMEEETDLEVGPAEVVVDLATG